MSSLNSLLMGGTLETSPTAQQNSPSALSSPTAFLECHGDLSLDSGSPSADKPPFPTPSPGVGAGGGLIGCSPRRGSGGGSRGALENLDESRRHSGGFDGPRIVFSEDTGSNRSSQEDFSVSPQVVLPKVQLWQCCLPIF